MTTDIKDALNFTANQAVLADGATNKLQALHLTPRVKLLVKPDGSYDRFDVPRTNVRRSLLTLAELALHAQYLVGQELKPLIFVSDAGCVLQFDDGEKYDAGQAFCPFEATREHAWLKRHNANELSRQQMLTVCRTILWDALGDPLNENLCAALRKVSVDTTQTIDQSKSRANYAATAGATVTTDGGFDQFESLTLQLRLYRDPGLAGRVGVRCSFTYDEHNMATLSAIGDDLADAEQNTVAAAIDYLRGVLGDVVPVFAGQIMLSENE